MALRLRRDVQKASYYVWFLGAEEAKGLRGSRVINSVLPYLIDRSRDQEPLKVTLQVSHKGIKIIQGSSKHFIPHSAITSSVQTDDIVACVLLLYNPATKCPLHVHAYRCDSETTAEALQQQLQILINRPENQKRFEELETRLGILQMPPHIGNKSSTSASSGAERGQKHFQSQHRRHESSPKRFSSSLGSDTGNSTRESECSEERDNISPMSRSPPAIIKQLQSNDLFDSLAAELRAKLNGNGPPLLLPPRDYDTVHRSKGNLAAIELRRCRNSLIVGNTSPQTTVGAAGHIGNGAPVKQVSSRGSSGIGSDLAPSPERQELHSSSDDEHWSNEADNSVIALKPSQIAIERSAPTKQQHHPQMNRKSAVQPPEDNYLRDLPSKPYNAHGNSGTGGGSGGGVGARSSSRDKEKLMIINGHEGDRSKTPASATSSVSSWNREDEIKPIIMRSSDYDSKFNRILMDKQRSGKEERQQREGKIIDSVGPPHTKLHDTDKYNEINRLLSKKLSLDHDPPTSYHPEIMGEYDESDSEHPSIERSISSSNFYHKDNLTDKQKFQEYSSKKSRPYGDTDPHRYGGRQRYVDPTDLPFEHPSQAQGHNKYNAVLHSPERDIHRSIDRQKDRQNVVEVAEVTRRPARDREFYSHSNERNPYRESESLPYIESMEKMMKSSAMRYTSFDATGNGISEATKDDAHPRVSLRKSYPKADQLATRSALSSHRGHRIKEHNMVEKEFAYTRSQQQQHRSEYNDSSTIAKTSPKDRFKDAKEKFRAMERSGGHHSFEDKDGPSPAQYVPRSLQRQTSLEPMDTLTHSSGYDNWSDGEDESMNRSRSRTREHWETTKVTGRQVSRDKPTEAHSRATHTNREHNPRQQRPTREMSRDSRDYREVQTSRDFPDCEGREPPNRDAYQREYNRAHPTRDYPRESRGEFSNRPIDNHSAAPAVEVYPAPVPAMSNSKSLSNLTKGYRHSYAEPVFARTGGRVGLAAVNPF